VIRPGPIVLVLAITLGCGGTSEPQPTPVPAVAPVAAIDTAPEQAAPPPPDAAPIQPIDVVRAAGRTDTVFHLRPAAELPCQAWRLRAEPGDDTRGRLIHEADPALSFTYRISGDQLELAGPYRGAAGTAIAGPLDPDVCQDPLTATADDRDAIEFAGGRWFFDPRTCESGTALAPRSCMAAVAVAIARVDRSRNLFDYLVVKRGPVTRLARADDGGLRCEPWRFGKDRLSRTERDQPSMYYELGYDGAALTLSGPMFEDDSGSLGMGSFGTYPIDPISDEVALVGAVPWFIRDAACDRAAAASRP
jgi:hypothetical protein